MRANGDCMPRLRSILMAIAACSPMAGAGSSALLPVPAFGAQDETSTQAGIDELIGRLEKGDSGQRAEAAFALGELAAAKGKHGDRKPGQSTEFAGADRAMTALVRAMADETRTPRGPMWVVAGQALGRFGTAAMPSVKAALEDDRLPVRLGAMVAIATAGPEAKEAVPDLIAILQKDEPDTRRFALNALIGIGSDAKAAVPAVIAMLDSDDFHTQYWACRTLGAIGPEARSAAPKLIELTTEGVTSVRRNAAAALGKIGPGIGDEGIAVLIRALSDPSQFVRQQAVIALGRLGPAALPAASVIEQGLRQGRRPFRPANHAARTLWRLKGKPELPRRVLLEELAEGAEPWETAEILGEIGPELGAVDGVAALLGSENRWARFYAAVALGQMGPEAASARPALEKALDDPDEEVREAVRQALKKITASASPQAPPQ